MRDRYGKNGGELNLAFVVDRGAYFAPLLSENEEVGFVLPDHLSLTTDVTIANRTAKVDMKLKPGGGILHAVAVLPGRRKPIVRKFIGKILR